MAIALKRCQAKTKGTDAVIMGMFVVITAAAVAAPAVSANAVSADPAARVVRYIVQPGDTIEGFAKKYLLSRRAIDDTLALSHIPALRKLAVGETLVIPVSALRWTPVNGRVKAFRGQIAVGGKPAVAGSVIRDGAIVTTAADSFVALEFPDGSMATMPSNSAVRIVSLRRYILTGDVDRRFLIQRGQSEWQVTPATHRGDRFEVRTPVALAAVRGTRFRVTYDGDTSRSGSGVVKGEVAFQTDATPQPTALPIGFGAVTDRAGAVDKRVLLVAPELSGRYAIQKRATVGFTAAPVAGAVKYLFEVGRDAALLDSVSNTIAATPEATLPPLADGAYFLRVSAVDAVGLQGFSRTYGFTRRLTALTMGLDNTAMAKFRWTRAGKGFLSYRFVLSLDPDLKAPLVDTPGLSAPGLILGPMRPGKYYWSVFTITPDGVDAADIESFEIGAP
jgi:hypothetical protein